MQPAIVKALKRLTAENSKWDGKGETPAAWDNAVRDAVGAIVAEPLGLDEVHLAYPTADAIDGYLAGIDATDEHGEPIVGPHRKLIAALGRLLTAEPQAWPPLESIDLLAKQGVGHQQIAKMHGLSIVDVGDILAGTKKYPANHVTPHVLEQRTQQKKMRDRLRLAAARWRAQLEVDDEQRAITAEDMLAEGHTVGDVAEEFDVSEDAVIETAEAAGFEPDDGDTSIEDSIVQMNSSGHSNADIAEALGVTVQRVAGVLNFLKRHSGGAASNGEAATKTKVKQKQRRAKARR